MCLQNTELWGLPAAHSYQCNHQCCIRDLLIRDRDRDRDITAQDTRKNPRPKFIMCMELVHVFSMLGMLLWPRCIKFAFERKSQKSNANWVLTNQNRALRICVWFVWLAFRTQILCYRATVYVLDPPPPPCISAVNFCNVSPMSRGRDIKTSAPRPRPRHFASETQDETQEVIGVLRPRHVSRHSTSW